MQKNYSVNYIKNLIDKYIKKGGEVIELEEGVLGYGVTMLYGEGLKTFIIKEYYINAWASGHTIRAYNKMPRKYEQILEKTEMESA